MATRVNVIPPVKCVATSKRRKKPCGNWAIPGTTVCRHHGGGTRAHRNKAVQRLTLATLLENDRRPVWEVLLDAVHTADALQRDARRQYVDGEQLTARHVENLIDSTKLAHHMARTAIDSGAAAKIADVIQRNLEQEGQIVAGVLGQVLDALLAALAGPSLALPPERAERLRAWAFGAARDALAALEDPTRPTVSVPPPPLDGLALVLTDRPQLEPAASSASSESSSAARWRPAAGRQPTPAADTATARPATRNGTSARTADDDASDEPLDAELVYDGDEPRPVFGRVGYRATSAEHREELATRLRAVRLTRVQLAELTGLGDHAVWRALNGRVHEDELPTWDRLLDDLDVADRESSAGPEPAPEPRDPIARGWEDAGREDHPLSERLNRAAERSWSRDAT